MLWRVQTKYLKTFNIGRTNSENLNVSRLVLELSSPNSLKAGFLVKNEDVVGAAPTTSVWSTSSLFTKVCLILELWRYVLCLCDVGD